MNSLQKMRMVTLINMMLAAAGGSVSRGDGSVLVLEGKALPAIDVQAVLGCQEGMNPSVNNAALINAALANMDYKYDLQFPAGTWVITEPIVIPGRSGYRIFGAGMSKDFPDNHYDGSRDVGGGRVTRIVWMGNDTDPMIRYDGLGCVVDGIHFQGRPVPSGGEPYYEPPHKVTTAASNASGKAIVITSANHGLASGNSVDISGVVGNTAANGTWTVTRLTSNTFSLNGSAGSGAYTGGGWWTYAKARIGIHVRTSTSHGGINTGKIAVRNCSFWQIKTDFLFGTDMSSDKFRASEQFAGEYAHFRDVHADESVFDNLMFFKPPVDASQRDEDTCFRFRSEQSVAFHVGNIKVNGGSHVFWFEYGGKLFADHVSMNSFATLLRLGTPNNLNGYYKITFDVDQGSNDNVAKLLTMDRSAFYAYVDLTGKMPATYMADGQPIVDAKGACNIVLRVDGLRPGSIKVAGVDGGPRFRERVANVALEHCTLWSNTPNVDQKLLPSDLLVGTADDRKWYRLTWRDCLSTFSGAFPAGFEMHPIKDGSITSSGRYAITPLEDPRADR